MSQPKIFIVVRQQTTDQTISVNREIDLLQWQQYHDRGIVAAQLIEDALAQLDQLVGME